jgi:GntP family gluconate:H+ symporter
MGETPVALLVRRTRGDLRPWARRRGKDAGALEKLLETSLGPVCSVILITGAGGMFGGVLRTSGIGKQRLLMCSGNLGIPLIVAAFLISSHPSNRTRLGHRGA